MRLAPITYVPEYYTVSHKNIRQKRSIDISNADLVFIFLSSKALTPGLIVVAEVADNSFLCKYGSL